MIRNAVPEDYDAYTRLVVELGVDDPIPDRDRFLADIMRRSIVVDDGQVVGYALFDTLAKAGYVRNVISDPEHRRRGIGRALMTELRDRFITAGARTWHLNVKPENTAAIALYMSFGMQIEHTTHVVRVSRDIPLAEPPGMFCVERLEHEADLGVERRFKLLSGTFENARAKRGREPLTFRFANDVVGAAVFTARIPGAYPFRLESPSDAAHAVVRLRELAEGDILELVVENDEPLFEELQRIGGTEHLTIVHMSGPL
ncbi:MAG: GNAT family N-acetyltransferase [Kofleriaceae bacterium]